MPNQAMPFLRATVIDHPPRPSCADLGPGNAEPQLYFNRRGIIFNCSDTAARMFGCRPTELDGLGIGSLIPDLSPGDSSSYNARRLAHLVRHGGWQRLTAIDRARREFPVEVLLSRVDPDAGQPCLLQLRYPARL